MDKIHIQAESLDVSRRLTWLGILNPDEVDYALRASDLTVFPSLAESFGLGLAESMAVGCPVAVADRPYALDVCGEVAVYFDPNDPASIARTVIAVCHDDATMVRLRSMGNERKEQFAYEQIAENITKVFEAATRQPITKINR